jgi:hypothetical protein
MSSSPDPFQSYFDSHEPKQELDSPFLNEALFVDEETEATSAWETRLNRFQIESPFLDAFEEGWGAMHLLEMEDEESSSKSDLLTLDYEEDESEPYEEGALDLEGGIEDIYIESEDISVEEKAREQSALPFMKFEFQTRNKIWRNDVKTKTACLLPRKYGLCDFLVAEKDLTLESENGGFLEFETKWQRKWTKLEAAITKACEMTKQMNKMPILDNGRRLFTFDIQHLRTRSTQGCDDPSTKENKGEKILGKDERLEVEFIDIKNDRGKIIHDSSKWLADIQSSEGFLLHLFKSYLNDHEEPMVVDSVIKNANKILNAAKPDVPSTELENLRSFLQIVVYYIIQGQCNRLEGEDPSKYAFRLMNRTSFYSIYQNLLSRKQKKLFDNIVKGKMILTEMKFKCFDYVEKKYKDKIINVNEKTPFFVNGYSESSSHKHENGPTIHDWLLNIILKGKKGNKGKIILKGKDLLSNQFTPSLSDAMGRFNVVTKKPGKDEKEDRWLVKFETRNTILGRKKEAKDWVAYAYDLYDKAKKRRRQPIDWILSPLGTKNFPFLDLIAKGAVRDAISLAYKHGITDEIKLTDLVFHSLHPELGGRKTEDKERDLKERWRLIRVDWVRPLLQSAGSHEVIPFNEDLLDLEMSPDYEQSGVDLVTESITDGEFEEDESDLFLEELSHEFPEEVEYWDYETEDNEVNDGIEALELDPTLVDIAEKIIAREVPFVEHEKSIRWTQCFSVQDVANVEKVYKDNVSAASSNSVDRCSCIVMLNVALGQLLPLRLKTNRARGESNRLVQMGDLTTDTIEKAMERLRQKGFALKPTLIDFYDRRDRTAGTLRPERLKISVQDKVLAKPKTQGCWFAFALSIMDGYHSVLLLVDHTSADVKIYWLDQFSSGLDDDVTNSLDQRLIDKTQSWWQAVMDTKHKGYKTTIRLWQLRKPS